MTHVEDELNSQPECWTRVAAEAAEHAHALPVAGSGSRSWAAAPRTSWRRPPRPCGKAPVRETDAFAASEFPYGRPYDRVVALTRSGTTTEVLELLGRLRDGTPLARGRGPPR